MEKPKVDITETGGARWSMGKLVSDALKKELGADQQNIFLSEFNAAAPEGSDDDVLRVLSKYAVLVFEGEEIVGEESAALVVTAEEVARQLTVPKDPHKLKSEALEYYDVVVALDVAEEGYENVMIVLADTKAMISAIEAKRKDLTKGARETVKKINAELKPGEDTYKKAEGVLKEKLLEYRADVNSIRDSMLAAGEDPPEPVPEMAGVIVKDQWDIVIDESKVTRAYLCPDVAKIEAAVKAGKKVKGVTAQKVETLAVEHAKVER